jgi:hypothetical protein
MKGPGQREIPKREGIYSIRRNIVPTSCTSLLRGIQGEDKGEEMKDQDKRDTEGKDQREGTYSIKRNIVPTS